MKSTTDNRYILHPVWDPLLRALHWWMALAMMAQFTSGATLLALGNDMSDTLMGKIDIIHYVGGYAFAAGLVVRIIWLFVGPPTARWRDLLPLTPAQAPNLAGNPLLLSERLPPPDFPLSGA